MRGDALCLVPTLFVNLYFSCFLNDPLNHILKQLLTLVTIFAYKLERIIKATSTGRASIRFHAMCNSHFLRMLI